MTYSGDKYGIYVLASTYVNNHLYVSMRVYTYVCTCACQYILLPGPFESPTGSTSRLVRLINIYDFEKHFIDLVSSKSTTFYETLCSYSEGLVGVYVNVCTYYVTHSTGHIR